MAAFNFPNSPSDGDTHTENGFTYVWDGTNGAWKKNPASLSKGEKGQEGDKGDKGDNKGQKGQKGEPGDVQSKGAKGEPGADNSSKGQKGEPGADNSTKGNKGEPGADNSTKGQKGDSGSGATINNNADNRIITGSNTTGELNAEQYLLWNGATLTTAHSSGQIDVNPSDGSIEMTRANGGGYIDFKDSTSDDYDVRIAQDGTSSKLKVFGGLEVTNYITSKNVTKAFVNFHGGTNTNGNCTMRDAYNVSSVGDLGTGYYRINWSSSFPNANYTVTVSHSSNPNNGSTHGILYTTAYLASYVDVMNHKDDYGPDRVDKDTVCVVARTTHT